MTKAGLILKAIVNDIDAANYQKVVDTLIDRILLKFSNVDLPCREHFGSYMRHKWRMNHKPNTLKSSAHAVSPFLTYFLWRHREESNRGYCRQ